MSKLRKVSRKSDGALLGFAHWCEGCNHAHIFYTTDGMSAGPKWSFNGDMDKPTFSPSMRFFDPERKDANGNVLRPEVTLCHYFLTDGVVNYLGDSSDHEVRGNRPLVDIPEGYGV